MDNENVFDHDIEYAGVKKVADMHSDVCALIEDLGKYEGDDRETEIHKKNAVGALNLAADSLFSMYTREYEAYKARLHASMPEKEGQ